MENGSVLLLENVRFYGEETKNDEGFSKKLAANADMYVNDAFGTAHRAHSSTEGVAKILSPAVAGFCMQKELDYLAGAVDEPKRPFCAIVGGSKVRVVLTHPLPAHLSLSATPTHTHTTSVLSHPSNRSSSHDARLLTSQHQHTLCLHMPTAPPPPHTHYTTPPHAYCSNAPPHTLYTTPPHAHCSTASTRTHALQPSPLA